MSYLDETIAFVKVETADYDSSHDFEHAQWVFNNAMTIYHETNTNHLIKEMDCKKVIAMAAYLHDVCDHKYNWTEKRYSAMLNLIKKYCQPNENQVVIDIINNMSFSKEKKGLTKDMGKYQVLRDIVSDADKLEAIGDRGLQRCHAFTKTLIGTTNPQIVKHMINHCHDKLLDLLPKYIRTDKGKEMGVPLHKVIVDFCDNPSSSVYSQIHLEQ